MAESVYDRINDYGSVKVSLASPNDIRSWSFGEVKKPETINYRTYRPEKDGLFCERIFGPERDWECACGKYKGTKHKGMICDRCGVKVTHSRVRRKRMGHINLAAPVVHIWFFKAMPSRLGTLLDMKTISLEKVVYFQDYVVTDPGQTPLKYKELLTEEDFRTAQQRYGNNFRAVMGAEGVKELLLKLDLPAESEKLRDDLSKTNSKQKIKDLTKRLMLIEAIRQSENRPEWLVLDAIPVIPPDLRPLVLLESGNFATSDLNDLYRRIINRNNRLKKLVDLNAPEVIIRNEKRMLQQAVDALFDNGRCRRPVLGSSNRPLKSLTDMIKGKQGRFRENLLGKRVDYSARSVIVVGPELKLHQCGLPKKIALELFQPFIIRKLRERGLADTIKSAKKMLERREQQIWDILEEVIYQHPVLLNRAPTLHRMGIQAFEPVLVEGNAIKIHPLVCKGFNADFDGDQMAVHVPLSVEAQAEAHTLMMSVHNIFSPANGSPIMSPSQDIVLGIYYLTCNHPGELGEREPGKELRFANVDEALLAYDRRRMGVHTPIRVRITRTEVVNDLEKGPEALPPGSAIVATVGRCIFNDILPPEMPFYNCPLSQDGASEVIDECHRRLGRGRTVDLLDSIKEIGFRHSTLAGLSFGLTDMRIPAAKSKIIDAAQKTVERIERNCQMGAITELERHNQLIDVWVHARERVTAELMRELASDRRDEAGNYLPPDADRGEFYLNPIFLMSDSGARGSVDQIRQLAGMRALMAKPSGEIIETPIKSNFREGLSVLEYFSSTHGARKGLADTALKTADSGYLTRKLADVAQNVVVNTYECGAIKGIKKGVVYKGEEVDVPLAESIVGRVARDTIRHPVTDEIIVRENEVITLRVAARIEKELRLEELSVRSPLTCESPLGICAKCYGWDMSTGKLVEEGMAVGILGAQSIGEPGTQLTMQTFHTGGVASHTIVQSEIRNTQAGTVVYHNLSPVEVPDPQTGKPEVVVLKRNGELLITDPKGRELERYKVPYGAHLMVKDGQEIAVRIQVCQWDAHLSPILAEVAGDVRYQDIVEGETVRPEQDRVGAKFVVIEHKGEKHPQIIIEAPEYATPAGARPIPAADIEAIEERLMLDYPVGETPEKQGGFFLLARWNFDFAGYTTVVDRRSSESSDSDELIKDWGRKYGKLVAHPVFEWIKRRLQPWYDDPHTVDTLPPHRGIYFLRDKKTKKISDGYIGRATDLRARLQNDHYSRTAVPHDGKTSGSALRDHVYEYLLSKSAKKPTGEDIRRFLTDNYEFTYIDLDRYVEEQAGRRPNREAGKILDFHYLPAKARIEVRDGDHVIPGMLLARQPREIAGTQDITGGLPRVTELFEARKPKEPAMMAEISGTVEIRADRRRGKMTIIARAESGMEKEHHVPQDKQLLVHAGDYVEAGDPLIEGPLIPHDILRIRGEESLQTYLLNEIQAVYRSQNVSINDKHIEIIVGQMMRKVKVDNPGDSRLLPGQVVDKFKFRDENERLAKSLKIVEPGDTDLAKGQIVTKEELGQINEATEEQSGVSAKGRRPKPATARTLLLGITKASLQSESFISAASFQETTKVLTEAALAGAVDQLMCLKENVILGHLIPAGTGFKPYLEMQIRHLGEPVPVREVVPVEPPAVPVGPAQEELAPDGAPLNGAPAFPAGAAAGGELTSS